jgi:A/G-specific adenine glycosylase
VTRYDPAEPPVDVDPVFRRSFQDRIVRWYRREGRDLPWRSISSAYQVAVSEILLQQTQAARVAPVFEAFVRRWPRVQDLHAAQLEDVKGLTDPLGYHIRGTWLKEMARIIVERHDGRMPDTLEALRELPGLGPYAAAAVYVFGLRRRAALLDTNIARVLTRAVGLPAEGSVYRDSRRLHDLAEQLVPARRHYDYHQGLMDLGATVCLSRSPRCDSCPLRRVCRAVAGGPAVATWHEHGVAMAAERTVGYRVGSRMAVSPSAKDASVPDVD